MEQNMFNEWNGIGPIFFSGIGPKAKAIGHSCKYCTLKQQATWHECKVLEGKSYIVQDSSFFPILMYQGLVTIANSFPK